MKLSELIKGLDNVEVRGDSDVEIMSINHDSRKVSGGSLFIAVKGFMHNGNTFIPSAVKKGAAAVMTDEITDGVEVPLVLVQDVRKSLSLISDRFYGSPQEALVMVGITGTNGKTTTSYMVKSIFETGGIDCGLIGTIGHLVAGREITALNTTPEATDLLIDAQVVEARVTADDGAVSGVESEVGHRPVLGANATRGGGWLCPQPHH